MSKEPLYQVIKNDIISKISSGVLAAGNFLPTERELMEKYAASRGTVRKAIDELEKSNYVNKKPYVGVYVAYPKIEKGLKKLTGFHEDIKKRGGKPSTKLLEIRIISPTREVREALKSDDDVYLIDRLRYDSGYVVARDINYIPVHLCPGITQEMIIEDGLYSTLEKHYMISLDTAIQTVEPRKATKEDVLFLDTDIDDLLLKCCRTSYLANGTPVEYTETLYRTDRYKFIVTLTK